jgi:hypothetical protein
MFRHIWKLNSTLTSIGLESRPKGVDMRVDPVIALCSAIVLLTAASTAAAEPWKRHIIDNSSRGADGVRLGDVNGDGLPDIATGWEEGGVIRVYVNPGAKAVKQQWPAVTAGQVKSPEDAVLIDLDNNRAVDVVSCCEGGTRTVYVHWAPKARDDYLDASKWKTEAIPSTAGKQAWMYCLPMQVDGKRGVDLVVGSKGGGATVGWLESPEDPRDLSAWKLHAICPAGWIMSLESADINADDHADVLVSDRRGGNRGVFWLENPGPTAIQSGATWKRHPIGAAGREVMFLSHAGKEGRAPYVVAAAVKPYHLYLFFQLSVDSITWQSKALPISNTGIGSAKAVFAGGDINKDGMEDYVYSCEHATGTRSGVFWATLPLKGTEKPTIHDISGPQGVKFDLVNVQDLDDDGDLDVLTCEERDNLGVIWYENPLRP